MRFFIEISFESILEKSVTIKLFIQLGIKKSKKEGINEGNKKVLNWENWSVHILIILIVIFMCLLSAEKNCFLYKKT
jgi:hypothetical protein